MERNILSIDCDWVKNSQQLILLNEFVFNKFIEVENIVFLKNHHQIVNYIDTPVNIFNIDHHHDINYDHLNKFVNPGNWVQVLIQANYLKSYTWIHNSNSDMLFDNITHIIRDLEGFSYSIDLEDIKDIKYDKIFICESFGYLDYLNEVEKEFFIPYNTFKQVASTFFKEKVLIDKSPNQISYSPNSHFFS